MPETTVVIRTFNEARHLPGLLQRLKEQKHQDFETILVDSGSIDGTREIAREWGATVIRIDRSHFTFGYSLNVGIRAGRGRFVSIVSAHTLPLDADWLGNLVSALRAPQVAMVYGRQVGASTSKFSEVQDLRRTFGERRRVLRPPEFFANNANSAIRRDLWEQYPFDTALPGLEDIDWARKWMERGYEVVYEPAAAVHHIHEESWQQVRHRYYREGVAARVIGLKGQASVVKEAGLESGYLLADLGLAVRQSVKGELDTPLTRCAREIISFRLNKAVGTVRGLLDGTAITNLETRDEFFFDSSFDAVVIEGPGRARLKQVEMPEIRPGDVVIKVAYVGVCGTDLEIYDGRLGYFGNGLGKYPIVPGHEASGRVAALGARVDGLQEHDPVVIECIQSCDACEQCRRENWIGCPDRKELGVLRADGAYARYVVVPNRFVHKLPSNMDLARAALCEPLAVVLKGLDRLSRAWPPESGPKSCAVIGAGPLGRLCAIVLAHRGHCVTVYDRDPKRLDGFRDLGISTVDSLRRLGDFEALIEATGDPGVLGTILGESGPGSTILLLGLPYAQKVFNFENVVAYDKTIVGSVGSRAVDFRAAIELLPELDLAVYLRHIMPLERFAEGWQLFRRHDCLKVLLKVD